MNAKLVKEIRRKARNEEELKQYMDLARTLNAEGRAQFKRILQQVQDNGNEN